MSTNTTVREFVILSKIYKFALFRPLRGKVRSIVQ